MKSNEEKLLNRLYQDAQVAMISIDKVLKKLEDDNLKRLFRKQFDSYQNFAEKCDILAVSRDFDIVENSFWKRFKQTAMVYMSLWMDKTPRHIVEIMINGTVMGINDTIKMAKDLKVKDDDVSNLVLEFKKMQEEYYEKLKKQLAKV